MTKNYSYHNSYKIYYKCIHIVVEANEASGDMFKSISYNQIVLTSTDIHIHNLSCLKDVK